jgi:pimeloyl-ACP methyl ester carboxylesterase
MTQRHRMLTWGPVTHLFAWSAALAVLSCSVSADSAAQRTFSAAISPVEQPQEQFWRIPYPSANVYMNTVVRLPGGSSGPFPLVLINHGSSESARLRAEFEDPTFESVSSWFLKLGYAVAMPQRPGHGKTGGPYLEGVGNCDSALYEQAGFATADSIKIAIDYLRAQPFIKKGPVLLVGHSAGAWGALALAARSPELVSGVINFSGGRGGRSYGIANRNCAPARLVSAAAAYGRATRVPTLWLYAKNDTFFGPELSRQMAEAFQFGGGPVDYHLLPSLGDEGHYLIYSAESVREWSPLVEKFARGLQQGVARGYR